MGKTSSCVLTGCCVGYARVSTEQQDLTAQRNGLNALGVGDDRIYADHGLTGTNRDRPAQAEADLRGREFVGDSPGVGQGPGETVEFGHHQGVPGPAGSKRLAEPRSLTVGAGEAVVDVDPFGLDTQAKQSVALSSQALSIGRAAGVPDKAARSWRTSRGWPGRTA